MSVDGFRRGVTRHGVVVILLGMAGIFWMYDHDPKAATMVSSSLLVIGFIALALRQFGVSRDRAGDGD